MIWIGYVGLGVCVCMFLVNIAAIVRGFSTVPLIASVSGTVGVINSTSSASLKVVLILFIMGIDFGLLPWISRKRRPR